MAGKKTFYTLLILLTFTSLMSSSCGLSSLVGEELSPVPEDTKEPLRSVREDGEKTAQPVATKVPDNQVKTLQDVRSAVIQIEFEGTFVDPEFGEYSESGTGSGFIIDESGLAVTNNHVVTGAALLKVYIGGDTTKTYNAQIIGVSECSDLALIDIEGEGYPYLAWYSDPIQVGLEVYAAGFPLGDPEYTLTKGIVSKENAGGESSWASVDSVIEHDATINPGNSGGPLISQNGQVVGVNYASFAAASQYFAIGRDAAIPLIEKFKKGENVDTLGINGVAVVSGDGTISGVWASSIKSGSAADEAGIQPGDLLTTMENINLGSDGTMASYCDIIRTQGDENTLGVEVVRFPTQQLLEGQINGRALSVVEDLGFASEPDTGEQEEVVVEKEEELPADTGGYELWTDSTGALEVSVPSSWQDTYSAVWENVWELSNGKTINFRAADMILAPDIDAYLDFYGPGVQLSASRDWGNIGGYIQLLDGLEFNYIDICKKEERDSYIDEAFEGGYDWWNCDSTDFLILAARPIADPTAYLVLVRIAFDSSSEPDWEFVDEILNTFNVSDYYSLP